MFGPAKLHANLTQGSLKVVFFGKKKSSVVYSFIFISVKSGNFDENRINVIFRL